MPGQRLHQLRQLGMERGVLHLLFVQHLRRDILLLRLGLLRRILQEGIALAMRLAPDGRLQLLGLLVRLRQLRLQRLLAIFQLQNSIGISLKSSL